jgi:Mg2+ and Co2+ transporter CorA
MNQKHLQKMLIGGAGLLASASLINSARGQAADALIDKVVDRYFPVLDQLETELETIEEQIFVKNQARSNIEALYDLKRKLMVLKHAVDPLMEAVGKLYGGRVPQICAGMEWAGLKIDHKKNQQTIGKEGLISSDSSRLAVYAIPTDEELLIARDTVRCILGEAHPS